MIVEPESWTGLRPPAVVDIDLADDRGLPATPHAGRPSALRTAAHFVVGLVGRIAHRHEAGRSGSADFLRARRLTVFDEPTH